MLMLQQLAWRSESHQRRRHVSFMVSIYQLGFRNRRKSLLKCDLGELWHWLIVLLSLRWTSLVPAVFLEPLCSRLVSDVKQHTGRVHPGAIEIHLQSCDLHQAAPMQHYRSFGGTMGDNRRMGEQRRLHLRLRRGRQRCSAKSTQGCCQ